MDDSTRHEALPAQGQQENDPVTQAGSNKPAVDIIYFGIRTRRLILLTLLTAGIYNTYWFYKQWQAIKKAEKSDIWPLCRALFSIFFLYGLCERIYISAKNNNYPKVFPYQNLARDYLIFIVSDGLLFSILPHKIVTHSPFFLLLYISWLLFSILVIYLLDIRMLFYAQRAINFNNAKLDADYKLPDTYTLGEVILIAIGVYPAIVTHTIMFINIYVLIYSLSLIF